jgi:hypothetical protein
VRDRSLHKITREIQVVLSQSRSLVWVWRICGKRELELILMKYWGQFSEVIFKVCERRDKGLDWIVMG